jgi:hypothetical protein
MVPEWVLKRWILFCHVGWSSTWSSMGMCVMLRVLRFTILLDSQMKYLLQAQLHSVRSRKAPKHSVEEAEPTPLVDKSPGMSPAGEYKQNYQPLLSLDSR